MIGTVLGLLAETSLHPGAEATGGLVDLPVAREAATGYPVITGSSLKGAMRDRANQHWGWADEKEYTEREEVLAIFGREDNAGALSFTDARIILLPVRSLSTHFKWVTCPYLLERFQRDCQLAGYGVTLNIPPQPASGQVLVDNSIGVTSANRLFLEELSFEMERYNLSSVIENLKPLIRHNSVRGRLAQQLVILNDDDFAYFARYGLQVNAHNVLNKKTKTSENLWYEETIPPDTLFYALVFARPGQEKQLAQLLSIFNERPYLQVGGNETTGQGWCAVNVSMAGGDRR